MKRDLVYSIVCGTLFLSVLVFPPARTFADETADAALFEANRQAYLIGQDNFKQIIHYIGQRYEDPNVDFKQLLARGLYEAQHWVSEVEGATQVITLATYAAPHKLNEVEYVRQIGNLIESRIRSASATVVSVTDLWTKTLASMVNALGDPYTQYLPPQSYNELQHFLSGEGDPRSRFYGVGIRIGWDYATNAGLLVVEPLPGTPAFLAGIQPGDVIVAVDDVPLSATGTPDENVLAAMERIHGPEGTKVKLTILRAGVGPFPINLVLERRPIQQDQLIYKEMLDKDTGWLKLLSFYQNCAADVQDALRNLKLKGMKKLILDFRYDPGGFLDEAVKVADLFLPQGALITYTKSRTSRQNFFDKATDDEGFTQLPIVILVNKESASASEVVTGALQDSGRARVVGMKTFGKGSVQELFQLEGDAGLRLTVAKYYTPKDRCIHEQGIQPDVEVQPSTMAMVADAEKGISEPNPPPASSLYHSRSEMLLATDAQLRAAFQLLNPDLASAP
jgi:carboxyl-terminal processing protease